MTKIVHDCHGRQKRERKLFSFVQDVVGCCLFCIVKTQFLRNAIVRLINSTHIERDLSAALNLMNCMFSENGKLKKKKEKIFDARTLDNALLLLPFNVAQKCCLIISDGFDERLSHHCVEGFWKCVSLALSTSRSFYETERNRKKRNENQQLKRELQDTRLELLPTRAFFFFLANRNIKKRSSRSPCWFFFFSIFRCSFYSMKKQLRFEVKCGNDVEGSRARKHSSVPFKSVFR